MQNIKKKNVTIFKERTQNEAKTKHQQTFQTFKNLKTCKNEPKNQNQTPKAIPNLQKPSNTQKLAKTIPKPKNKHQKPFQTVKNVEKLANTNQKPKTTANLQKPSKT